jgi:hypothetical protein
VITAAGADEDLWVPALDMLNHLSAERRATLVPMLGGLPDGLRERAQATIK